MNKEYKLKNKFNEKYPTIKYKTKCVFCKCEFFTIKGTSNEGICLNCRSVG